MGKKELGFDFLCTKKMGFTALGLVFNHWEMKGMNTI